MSLERCRFSGNKSPTIQLFLCARDQMKGKLVALDGDASTIQTDIITIETGIKNIQAKVTTI